MSFVKETCDPGRENFVGPGPHPSGSNLTQKVFCRDKIITNLIHRDSKYTCASPIREGGSPPPPLYNHHPVPGNHSFYL